MNEALAASQQKAFNTDVEKDAPDKQNTQEQQVKNNFNGHVLYEESLGFIPGSLRGKQDLRYVHAKVNKQYKSFNFTNEGILEIFEGSNLLQDLQLLHVSKPNKSIDIQFRAEDATNFFVLKHIEIRDKTIPFVRKGKRVLKVTVKGVHPEMSHDELMAELTPHIKHASSIKNTY